MLSRKGEGSSITHNKRKAESAKKKNVVKCNILETCTLWDSETNERKGKHKEIISFKTKRIY